jgi:hypothetical protein
LITDVIVSRIIIQALLKEYIYFKAYISSIRDDFPRLKMELRRVKASIKEEEKLTNNLNTSDSILKALLV